VKAAIVVKTGTNVRIFFDNYKLHGQRILDLPKNAGRDGACTVSTWNCEQFNMNNPVQAAGAARGYGNRYPHPRTA
jgi:hypothetical protein